MGTTGEIWNVTDGKLINRISRGCLNDLSYGNTFSAFSSQAYSPDGRFKATVDSGDLTIYYLANPSKYLYYYLDHALRVAFLPDGKYMAIAMTDGQVWFVPIASWESRLLNLEDDHTYYDNYIEHPLTIDVGNFPAGIIFSPNGAIMALLFKDAKAQMWDVTDLSYLATVDVVIPLSFSFSYDGMIFATNSTGGSIDLWDAHTGNLLAVLNQTDNKVLALSFSPSSRILASADSKGGVYIWGILPTTDHETASVANATLPTPISLPAPTPTPTSAIPSYADFLPMKWPIMVPTDEQILEAKACAIEAMANTRYPESINYQ